MKTYNLDSHPKILKAMRAAKTPKELGLAIRRMMLWLWEVQHRGRQFKAYHNPIDISDN